MSRVMLCLSRFKSKHPGILFSIIGLLGFGGVAGADETPIRDAHHCAERAKEAVETMTRNIITARRAIATPLILENVCSPLIWPGAEMDEPTFITQVLHHSGCGLLLDVTNIHANSTNHGTSPANFIEKLPLERVVQVHFSGAHESKGRLIDSRTQAVPESIWQLLDHAVSRAPVRCICLERDDNLPPLPEILWEVERARAIGRHHKRWN
ncbi:MAG: DUF692 family protein [Verrucomicrobia bacterium]|nr:DUF692 family protein [Verrucomicrobiota bacterium]